MQNRKGSRPGSPGQNQTQNPMQPNSPGINPNPEREEEEEEEGGSRIEDEEEATSVEKKDPQSDRDTPANPGRPGQDR